MSQRPMTSKPRGVCLYFRSRVGCRNGDMCKFLHDDGETLSPYDKSKTCKYYSAGFCKHGDKCWFRHTNEANGVTHSEATSSNSRVGSESEREDGEVVCSICQEKPVTYGLLEDCSHVFCLQCIRGWRDPNGKTQDIVESGNTKRCPYCRTSSKFVTPSSIFYPSGHPLKETTIANYKASMARIPCKYFERSSPGARYCPFGKDCFYQHKEADGTPYVFNRGADYYMKRSRRRRSQMTDLTFLDMLSNIPTRRLDNEATQALIDLRAQFESAYPRILEDAQENVEYFSELNNLLVQAISHLGETLSNSDASLTDDEQVDDGQAAPSRPSIFATSEDSTTSSALPLTRAFVDNNIPSEDDRSLIDAHESEEEDESDETSSNQTLLFRSRFRRLSLSNVANSWADDSDVRSDLVEDPLRPYSESDAESIEHTLQEQSQPLATDGNGNQETPTLDETPSVDESQEMFLSILPELPIVNDSLTIASHPNESRHARASDNTSSESDNHSHEIESRRKSEVRSESVPRRAKSANSATACGRRNGGQTFVTDGRGRVVATDDWANTDSASLAFWASPTPVAAPPSDSVSDTSAPSSGGLGALDDLD